MSFSKKIIEIFESRITGGEIFDEDGNDITIEIKDFIDQVITNNEKHILARVYKCLPKVGVFSNFTDGKRKCVEQIKENLNKEFKQ